MFETGIALFLGVGFWGIYAAVNVDPELLLFGGLWAVAGGFALGLPTGALYHITLYRSLKRIRALPPGWLWRPTSLHARIPKTDRFHVLGWCYLGATGFLVILAGIVITAAGALRLA
jgi:hypothetical protein